MLLVGCCINFLNTTKSVLLAFRFEFKIQMFESLAIGFLCSFIHAWINAKGVRWGGLIGLKPILNPILANTVKQRLVI